GSAAQVSNTLLSCAASGVRFIALLLKLVTPAKVAIALGVAAVAAFVTPFALRHLASSTNGKADPALAKAADSRAVPAPAKAADQSQLASNPNEVVAGTNSASGKLSLTIVAADTGKAVPNVLLDYWLWQNGNVAHRKPLQSTRFGVCEVPVPRNTTELLLVSESDGFADTRLDWRPDRGEKIPAEYTLRLTRAVPIGGRAVDADGNPVAGAKVSFGNRPDV